MTIIFFITSERNPRTISVSFALYSIRLRERDEQQELRSYLLLTTFDESIKIFIVISFHLELAANILIKLTRYIYVLILVATKAFVSI